LKKVEAFEEEAAVVLDFPDPGPFDKPIVRILNASFAYEKRKAKAGEKKRKAAAVAAGAGAGATGGDFESDDDDESDGDDVDGGGDGGGGGGEDKPPPPPEKDEEPVPNLLSNVDFQVRFLFHCFFSFVIMPMSTRLYFYNYFWRFLHLDHEPRTTTTAKNHPLLPPPQTTVLFSKVTAKSRIALLGRNGCGKSTLIKLIVGKLRPNRGGECLIDGQVVC
jgi:ABC-type multidrug transport system fused ATPase/permease subunit